MKTLNSSPSEAENLMFILLEAAGLVERRLDRALSNSRGVSFSEYRLLRVLAQRADGAATRVELAGAVGLTPSAITRALKPLEKLRYVTTVKSKRDARKSLAALTPGGKALLEDVAEVVADVIADLPLEMLDRGSLEAFVGRRN